MYVNTKNIPVNRISMVLKNIDSFYRDKRYVEFL
jgi:hypothetical protein